ncbi:MAG: FIST C-terminal domain-containing protein [Verrucomicrobiota bacterium]
MIAENQAASRVVLSAFDEQLLKEQVEDCRSDVGGEVDLAVAFVTSDWLERADDLLEVVQVYGHAKKVVVCSADGVIGTAEENENVSGCTLQLFRLPNTEIDWAVVEQGEVESAQGDRYWESVTGIKAEGLAGFVVLGNPALIDGETWLRSWNASYTDVPCFGGLASGGRDASEIQIVTTEHREDVGALVLGFRGGVRLSGIVSQGCRPIGDPYTITSVDDNVLLSIGSRGAYEVLEETFQDLDDSEKEIAQGNILAGLAVSEYKEELRSGDFLVRNILGGDPDAGALALGAIPRVGQTLQFQLRDRDAASTELKSLCKRQLKDVGQPFAGLLFSCTGRGTRMFEVPNHDAGIIEDHFGRMPLAGFFCNGEIGPIGGTNFLHGYTASLALFLNA